MLHKRKPRQGRKALRIRLHISTITTSKWISTLGTKGSVAMKRFNLVFLALSAMMTSCGPTDAPETTPTLRIWWAQWAPADGLSELGTRFADETGIQVQVHQIPWSAYQDQVFLNFGNRQTDFDIVVGDSQWIGRGASRNLYLDLTEWLPTAIDIDTIHPRAARYLCEYPAGSARFYAAPCETDAIGMIYRKDWFEDPKERSAFEDRFGRPLNPPETWAEFREVASHFYRPDQKRYGCALPTGRGYDSLTMGFQMILWAFGANWEEDQRVQGVLDTPAAAQALEFFIDLLQFAPPDASNLDYGQALEMFTNGSTAMALNYFAFFPGIVSQFGDNVGFAQVPGRKGRRHVSLGGQGFSISTKTSPERQERAKKFIAWFLQRDIQEAWITKDAGFTAHTDILKSETFATASPYNKAFAQSLDHVKDFWNVPVFNELLSVAQQHLGEALDGVKAPEKALSQIAVSHERILAEWRAAGGS